MYLLTSVLSYPSSLTLRDRRPRKEIYFPAGAEYFPLLQTSEPSLGTIQPPTPWLAMGTSFRQSGGSANLSLVAKCCSSSSPHFLMV